MGRFGSEREIRAVAPVKSRPLYSHRSEAVATTEQAKRVAPNAARAMLARTMR